MVKEKPKQIYQQSKQVLVDKTPVEDAVSPVDDEVGDEEEEGDRQHKVTPTCSQVVTRTAAINDEHRGGEP